MSCLARRCLYVLQTQKPIWTNCLNHASELTRTYTQYTKPKIPFYVTKCQHKFYSTCKRENPCKKKKPPEPKKPESFFASLFAPKKKIKKPPKESCRLLAAKRAAKCEEIPKFIEDMCKDLPRGACIYRTRGNAFILEVPCKPLPSDKKKSNAEKLLDKIERDKHTPFLEDEANPMPNYTTPGQRLIELQARKLHPLFRKLEVPEVPKPEAFPLVTKYRCIGDESDNLPRGFKDKDIMYGRKRDYLFEFKMAALPQYYINKTKLIRVNRYSALDVKKLVKKVCNEKGKYHFTECPEPVCKPPKPQVKEKDPKEEKAKK